MFGFHVKQSRQPIRLCTADLQVIHSKFTAYSQRIPGLTIPRRALIEENQYMCGQRRVPKPLMLLCAAWRRRTYSL